MKQKNKSEKPSVTAEDCAKSKIPIGGYSNLFPAEKIAHTPGPWKLIDETRMGPKGDVSIDYDIESVGTISLGDYRKEDASLIATAEANARLIAAAPELLEACNSALAILEGLEATSVIAGMASANDQITIGMKLRGAIAKAEGLSPDSANSLA